MKIVAILGSPHGMAGSTGALLNGLLDGVRGAGAEVTIFSLDALAVHPCTACDHCHMVGACAIQDDFDTILAAIHAADGVVLASPNYIINVSAQMKALLDRFSGIIHTQAFTGKYVASVVTSGGAGSEEVGSYLLRAMRMTGCSSVGTVGALGWQMARDDTRAPHLAAAVELGKKLVHAISTRRDDPEQSAELREIRARMRGLVMSQKDHWPYEYDYWTTQKE